MKVPSTNDMSKQHSLELFFFLFLFGIGAVLTFLIFSPYMVTLFLALVLTVLFSPVHHYFRKSLPKHQSLASGLAVLTVFVMVLTPLIYLGILLIGEITTVLYKFPSADATMQGMALLESKIQNFIPSFHMANDVYPYIGKILTSLASNLQGAFASIATFLLDLFVLALGMFFIFRDGSKLRKIIIQWSPLSDEHDERILTLVHQGIDSVVKGTIAIALIQGVVAGIGFLVAGVPNPVLWGFISVIAALVPAIGTGLVSLPLIVYMSLTGHGFAAIGLLIWWLGVVSTIDNVVRPVLLERGLNIHPYFILISVLGGLSFFGPVGFLAGPIVLSFFFALLEVYPLIIGRPEVRS